MSTDTSAAASGPSTATPDGAAPNSIVSQLAEAAGQPAQASPPAKKSRTNTPWTPAEERRLKTLRDAGSSWGEIAKEFPNRTEGSVKKHWYKDMHYADFAEDESAALLAAIREYEANKWKEIGKKVGKPAKVREFSDTRRPALVLTDSRLIAERCLIQACSDLSSTFCEWSDMRLG